MRTKLLIAGLILLNLGLGAALLDRSGIGVLPAFAQVRGRTDYIAVVGHSQHNMCIYVMDTAAGHLAAFRIDNTNRTTTPVAPVSVFDDMHRVFDKK